MTVFLIGYMGSGKSTIGKLLAEILTYDFIDLDAYIEQEVGLSVAEIFAKKGEVFFRKKESEFLTKLINEDNAVIALGGGTPCYGNNLERIHSNSNAVTVYLKSSIPILTNRLFKERFQRPLIAHVPDESTLMEFIGKHLFERAPYYEQSKFNVITDDKELKAIVEQIILSLF